MMTPEMLEYANPGIQGPKISEAVKPVKPADEALKPWNMATTKRELVRDGRVDTGVFARAAIFSEGLFSSQRRFRQQTVVAQGVLRTMEHEENPNLMSLEGGINLKLAHLTVEANKDRAVMVEAAEQYYNKSMKGTLGEAEREFLLAQLNAAQDAMYPQIDPDLARHALNLIKGEETADREPPISVEARKAWGQYLHEQYDPVFAEVYEQFDDSQEINGQNLADMTADFMRRTGLELTDDTTDTSKWKVIYSEDETGFRVTPSEKKITCGKRKEPLTRLGFEKLMMHEVIIHVWRAENGSRSGFTALQTGLPGYLETEEGLGLLTESLWSGEDPDVLSRDHYRYAAVAFANGDYDGVKHNEQETHDFIRPLMEQNGIGDNTDELFLHVMRIFRGMPPEARMRSNASYLSGKELVMELLEEKFQAGEPIAQQFAELRAGKNNPCDPQQVQLMKDIASMQAEKAMV